MKISIEKQSKNIESTFLQILFFTENSKILQSNIPEKEWLEKTLIYQITPKDKYFILHSGQKKFLLVNLKAMQSYKDLLHTGGKLGKHLLSNKEKDLGIFFFTKEDFSFKGDIDYAYESFLTGLLLTTYRYTKFKTDKNKFLPNKIFVLDVYKGISKAVQKAEVISNACFLAKNCANSPANYFYPKMFVEEAKKISKIGKVKTSFFDEKKLKKEKMNCILGVSQGSEKEAYLVMMEYYAAKKTSETLLLVGKGLTFDCGGISIKPSLNMDEMKFDMCGGAAVLGTMQAVAKLKPSINVIGIIPTSENLVNGKALKPGDVLTAYNGKTIEVDNTDAEGRLILADALAYGVKKFKPTAVIDLATLTGACVVALGNHYSGLMSNNDKLCAQVEKAGKNSCDKVWRLPVSEEYQEQIRGKQTDLNNIGGRGAGTITAGMFLQNFVGKTAWAHLDIAGTAWHGKQAHHTKGATAVGVRLLTYLVEHWKNIS